MGRPGVATVRMTECLEVGDSSCERENKVSWIREQGPTSVEVDDKIQRLDRRGWGLRHGGH